MPRDRRSPAGAGDELVVDLDDDGAVPRPRRTDDPAVPADTVVTDDDPARPGRRRWLRSRWTLPVVVLVVVLVVELSAGRQLRAAASAELARAVQLSAVQLGGASVTSAFTGDPASYDEQGRLLTDVQVKVLNSGTGPVRATVRGTSEPLLQLVGEPAAASVGPDGSNTLVLHAAVDCSKAPAVQRTYESSGDTESSRRPKAFSLDLDIAMSATGEGPVQRHRYLVADSGWGWGDITQQLAYACDPVSTGAFGVTTTPRDDGRLDVQVRNATDAPTTVALESTPWLHATSDVRLPAQVPARGTLSAVVTLTPDCRAAARPSQGGLDLRVDVVVLDQDGNSQPAQYPGTAPTSAWAARQVALTCG